MRSMTGFGQAEESSCGLSIEVIIKSVNHKSLDLSIRMPRRLYAMENAMRSVLQQEIKRGRVEVNVLIRPIEAQLSTLTVDLARADGVKQALDLLSERYGIREELSLAYWLQVPDLFVETPSELDETELEKALVRVTEAALADFIGMREREAIALERQLTANCDQIAAGIAQLELSIDAMNEEHEKKLRSKVEEILQSDPEFMESRLQQELLFYLDKSDVREELTRLSQHRKEFISQLQTNGPIGKRLDFLAQEMNREANTIASKSQQLLQTRSAIDMKVHIEQIREQIMNIE